MGDMADLNDLTAMEDVQDMSDCKTEGPPTKKRRRSAKPNSDKKFECKHEDCGKSYSRAEHLYRHQLNHTPKNIYRCDYPDCNRYFVRQDLCIRHRERHTTHGSQLHRRDGHAQVVASQSNLFAAPVKRPSDHSDTAEATNSARNPVSPHALKATSYGQAMNEQFIRPEAVARSRLSDSAGSSSTATTDSRFHAPTPHTVQVRTDTALHRTNSNGSGPLSPIQKQPSGSWNTSTRRDSNNAKEAPFQQSVLEYHGRIVDSTQHQAAHSPVRSYSTSSTSTNHPSLHHQNSFTSPRLNASTNGYTVRQSLPPTNYAATEYLSPDISQSSNAAFAAAVSQGLNGMKSDPYVPYPTMSNGMSTIDLNAAYGYPIFGGDDYNRSPFAMADDFTAWLFNENQSAAMGLSSNTLMPGYNDSPAAQVQGPYFMNSPTSTLNIAHNISLQHQMSMTNLMEHSSSTSYIMSEGKRQELLDLMQTQFIERPHDAVKKRKDNVFEGEIDDDGHILSLRMMHTYIGSYWYHQHAQLPILHKPTFNADKTPNLLLLAVIAIGAATMDKAYGTSLTDSAAEFANFIAWHIRWEIVRDADFRPPAKLWVFQTLLLIEVYEKMYATRALHERAHIHHDSTLTLMRRGSSLLGRSASDSPPSRRDDNSVKSSNSNSANETSKSEESWARWITTEATRRAAFAAFVIDSIHATMFGHSAKMVAHEMRLPLPCDEGLWSAVSPAEAGRVQSSLQTNGIKPTMFLDGLKKTLNGQRVRTNSFGRTIIMAGLLSVSWHMAQRDLQINSLGPRTVQTFGGPDKWKGALLRAFDNWKRDFDEALAEATPALHPNASPDQQFSTTSSEHHAQSRSNSIPNTQNHLLLRPVDDENIFESRTVLHHLAHIAAHVDVVDCQVFAGANRLMGRSITPKDYSVIREKITDRWATKASARDAAFYALKFLAQVLIPNEYDGEGGKGRRYGHASPILPQAFDGKDMYMARDDFLLNRPWVLYISALVVWCYGFALEGPITPQPKDTEFDTYEKKDADMRKYLERVAINVRAPDDLVGVTGKNRCVGLLMLLGESFGKTRWELTHEASGLLGNCVGKLMGRTDAGEGGTGVAGRRMAGG